MNFVKPNRKVEKIFLHCTAYPHQDLIGHLLIEAINRWHVARNFREIGYHYVIDKNGQLLNGRSLESNPAAQSGHNSQTIAVCLDGLYFNQFNKDQFDTLEKLAKEIDESYDNKVTYHGHCEVANKECPVFDYPAVLGLNRSGQRVRSYRSLNEKTDSSNDIVGNRILSLTCKGKDVIKLQELLGSIIVDGIFGQDTYNSVIKFQKDNDLVTDGIVGPITWRELLAKI